jgi:hypothetical protein
MGPVPDAETDRIIGGCVQTDESVPDSNRQLPDLPDGRPGRREAMLPVFKKGKYRLVHLYLNIRPRLLINDLMDVTAMGQWIRASFSRWEYMKKDHGCQWNIDPVV